MYRLLAISIGSTLLLAATAATSIAHGYEYAPGTLEYVSDQYLEENDLWAEDAVERTDFPAEWTGSLEQQFAARHLEYAAAPVGRENVYNSTSPAEQRRQARAAQRRDAQLDVSQFDRSGEEQLWAAASVLSDGGQVIQDGVPFFGIGQGKGKGPAPTRPAEMYHTGFETWVLFALTLCVAAVLRFGTLKRILLGSSRDYQI